MSEMTRDSRFGRGWINKARERHGEVPETPEPSEPVVEAPEPEPAGPPRLVNDARRPPEQNDAPPPSIWDMLKERFARNRRKPDAEQPAPSAPDYDEEADDAAWEQALADQKRRGGVWRYGALAALVIGAGAVFFLTRADVQDAAADRLRSVASTVSTPPSVSLAEVRIRGRVHSEQGAILDAAGLAGGATTLAFDAAEARASIEALPWVESAEVTFEPPRGALIVLQEKAPAAVWQTGGEFWIVTREGEKIIRIASPHDRLDLPWLIGDGAEGQVDDALRLLAGAPSLISDRLAALVRIGGRRWNAVTVDGVTLKLPEIDPQGGLRAAADMQRRVRLLDRDVVSVDLRIPGETPTVQVGQKALDAFGVEIRRSGNQTGDQLGDAPGEGQ